MEAVVERCVGIDIGKATLKATVRVPGGAGRKTRREVRMFETTTPDLLALRDWLVQERVTLVGMESTGVFWKPIYYVLEDVVECWLLNAQHLKKVPGRKTDVSDSEWIAELVAHGLVRASFVPPRPIRRVRDLTRYRAALTQERTREIQRLQNGAPKGRFQLVAELVDDAVHAKRACRELGVARRALTGPGCSARRRRGTERKKRPRTTIENHTAVRPHPGIARPARHLHRRRLPGQRRPLNYRRRTVHRRGALISMLDRR